MTEYRNKLFKLLYKFIFKPLAFKRDPEQVHDNISRLGKFLGSNLITRFKTSLLFNYQNSILEQKIAGITFRNPVGLAAGFDKNAELTQILPEVGFGFEEIGSVTGEPCEGNPRPRLWRAVNSKSLLVYYGLKNDGAEAISTRLSKLSFKFPIGVSIAKTNCECTADTEEGIKDYVKAHKTFISKNIGDYFTINISCPNAFGGQPFTDVPRLEKLMSALFADGKTKPVFVKLSPDLSDEELEGIVRVCERYKIDGFICSNLTKKRENPKLIDNNLPDTGGFSGKVQEDLSKKQLSYLYQKYGKKFILIACGGIFSAEDAYDRIKSGASLLQLITGMIFEGPQLISDINLGLVDLLHKDGYKNISEAVGRGK